MSKHCRNLSLKKETIRHLNLHDAQRVDGGVVVTLSILISLISSAVSAASYAGGLSVRPAPGPGSNASVVTCRAASGCKHYYTCNPDSGPSQQSGN